MESSYQVQYQISLLTRYRKESKNDSSNQKSLFISAPKMEEATGIVRNQTSALNLADYSKSYLFEGDLL